MSHSTRQFAQRHAEQRFAHHSGLLELELVRGQVERRILLALLELCGLWLEQTGPVSLGTEPLWARYRELHARVHAWRPSLRVMVN